MPLANKFDTLFLDRDGVLNKKIDNGYVLNFEQIEIMPGITEFLALAKKCFKTIVVVTNQRCIGRGLISLDNIALINNRINELTGSYIDHFYVCPHLDEDNCDCRKPKTGMFLQAQKHNIDFGRSWMLGDSESDMIPAKQLGIATFLISDKQSVFADVHISNIQQIIYLLQKAVFE